MSAWHAVRVGVCHCEGRKTVCAALITISARVLRAVWRRSDASGTMRGCCACCHVLTFGYQAPARACPDMLAQRLQVPAQGLQVGLENDSE